MRVGVFCGGALLVACAGRPPAVDASALPSELGLLVFESSSGQDSAVLEAWAPVSHAYQRQEGFGLDPDSVLRAPLDPRTGRRRFFSLQRRQGVVVERDSLGVQLARIEVFDPGTAPARANPHDLAIAPDGSLYIARYGHRELLIVGPDGSRRTVDLGTFADGDGVPEADAVTFLGGVAYVTLARIHGSDYPTLAPLLVGIDEKTLVAKQVVELPCKVPSGELRVGRAPTELWVACLGAPLSSPISKASGLVRIDTVGRTATRVLPGETLDAFPTAFAFLGDDKAVAILAAFADGNATSVVAFDPRGAGALGATWISRPRYLLWDLEVSGDTVFVADRDEKDPAVLVLGLDGKSLGRVRTRLPPVDLVVVDPR